MKKLSFFIFSLLWLSQTYGHFAVKEWKTVNGTHVLFSQAMEVPMLTIKIAFAAGSAYEGQQFGLSTLTTALLDKGSGGFGALTIADKLADAGAQFTKLANRNLVLLTLKTLTEKNALNQAIDVFSLMIAKADFLPNAFVHAKKQQIRNANQMQEAPDHVANLVFFKTLYGNHPYAHPVQGTQETLDKIEISDVKQFYKQYFVAKNSILVLVGAINEKEAHQIAEKLTQTLPPGQAAKTIPQAIATRQENIKVDFSSNQTSIRIGEIGINFQDPAYFPLLVGNYILGGGGLVSRLAEEIRQKRGLTYSILSQFIPMPSGGPFIIALSTRHQQASKALQATMETLGHFIAEGPSQQEINEAKKYLIGNFPFSWANNENKAMLLLTMAFFHLPSDYLQTYTQRIQAITSKQIKQAFQEKLSLKDMSIVMVGMK